MMCVVRIDLQSLEFSMSDSSVCEAAVLGALI